MNNSRHRTTPDIDPEQFADPSLSRQGRTGGTIRDRRRQPLSTSNSPDGKGIHVNLSVLSQGVIFTGGNRIEPICDKDGVML
ncbi:hypothetical protein [Oleisolibacter albus]|uniref:hypothetical protein n=1 Tax=Oleisolibacter albus TaxID=2171757 RepID=UPI0012D84AE3|nr:hypothetical protein [Oleisolibacter albus]